MDINKFLRDRIENIVKKYNCEETGGFITGDGPIPCNVLFIGEAPGKNEVAQGKPFVGMAGETFNNYLKSIGLSRSEVRITNTCFFRPIKKKVGKTGRTTISNRPPKVSEVNLFREVLDDEINFVNPKIIITLGNVPLKRLTEFKSIGDCHGNLYYNENLKINIFPMYHPSALTYNRNDEFKKMYENDWLKLKEVLKTI
ncbi:uracil-DNA glycosylase [Clostridium botulinum C]|uniref:Uracil-DNA glycosylase n=3 Tax=Clostridium botulinum TaxID=1491 RepID=A0A9Q4XY00_CLOBO|nr:uracil-DNA glycosylase [Clostridium botulinum]KMJ93185.1 uracil-DNA glycosylase [Clostridium botulinum C str. Stockholm]MBO3442066.1 uracil-DNA glycosylase [Clostridium haemolyticum]MCD3196169.1 uracil-DNA glycosylase [Clostridium botulinum C]MCD3201518.1 uracil-DNA glycosylase [Clostridium botulinum C]MCD3207091.1 uracil-DNA glycosylase [Clostridium botulinum C]